MAHLLCDEDSYVEPPNSADIQLLVLSDPDSNSESREYENTQIVLWEQEAPFYSEEMDAVTLPSDCEVVFLINSDVSDPSADVDLCDISMMEKELHPVNLQLQELLKEAQKIKITLLYSQNLKNHEDLVSSFMAFVALCQPYFTYTESTARSVIMDQNPLPEYIRRELLHFSQQLSTCLENLIKMFATFSLITLDEADPCGMSHFCCGEVRLESWYRVLLFRYCSLTPFNARDEPHSLYKKMRWNVELLENSCPSQGEAETKYYFLCCCKSNPETFSSSAQMSFSWSIGKGIQISPDPNNEDIYSWILCTHPTMKFQPLLNLGTEEPSTTQATDCLMEILQNPWMEGSLPLGCNPQVSGPCDCLSLAQGAYFS